jgi:hypothetical protein
MKANQFHMHIFSYFSCNANGRLMTCYTGIYFSSLIWKFWDEVLTLFGPGVNVPKSFVSPKVNSEQDMAYASPVKFPERSRWAPQAKAYGLRWSTMYDFPSSLLSTSQMRHGSVKTFNDWYKKSHASCLAFLESLVLFPRPLDEDAFWSLIVNESENSWEKKWKKHFCSKWKSFRKCTLTWQIRKCHHEATQFLLE